LKEVMARVAEFCKAPKTCLALSASQLFILLFESHARRPYLASRNNA